MELPNFLERPQYPNEYVQQYADTVTWLKGRHTFKFGTDINYTTDKTQNLRNQYGSYTYNSLVDYFSDLYGHGTACASQRQTHVPCYSQLSRKRSDRLGLQFSTTDLGFFAEDTWKATPRLTLTLGLRYEYEMMPSTQLANAAVPADVPVAQRQEQLGAALSALPMTSSATATPRYAAGWACTTAASSTPPFTTR